MILKLLSVLKRKEAKNASWLIFGRMIQMLLSFVVSIFTARFLGPSNFGLINYASAYVAFFTSICSLGINSIIVKDFIEKPNEQGVAIGSTLALRGIASVLSSIVIICISFFIDRTEPLAIAVVALSSVSLIFHIFETFNFWFQSRYQSKVTAIATLVAYVITSAYKIVLLILQKDVRWFAFANSVDYLVLAIALFACYRKYNGPAIRVSFKKGKELLSVSYHYIISGTLVAIYGQTDKLMLKQMLDNTSVGLYSLAMTINTMWVFVLTAIIDSMYPTIISSFSINKEVFARRNKQLYSIIIYVSIFVAIVFSLFGKTIINIVYGEEYLGAATSLRIVCWYTIFSYLGVARNAWVVCTNNQKYLKYMYVSAAFINVILNYLLIPGFGASGAAAASLITQILTSILLPLLIKDMRPNVIMMLKSINPKVLFKQ